MFRTIVVTLSVAVALSTGFDACGRRPCNRILQKSMSHIRTWLPIIEDILTGGVCEGATVCERNFAKYLPVTYELLFGKENETNAYICGSRDDLCSALVRNSRECRIFIGRVMASAEDRD